MTNPSTEQIEAARTEYDRSEDMCAALVAAAGVTPQGRREVLQRAHEVIKGVYANELRIPAYMLSRQAALALKHDGLLAAPVQVDEAKLAEVLLDHAMDFEQRPRPAGPKGSGYVCECGLEILEPRTGPGIGWWHRKHLANAVAEWLRGGGQ